MPVFPPLLVGVGLVLAAYGTLIGAGGAIVLLPVLIFLYPDAPPETLTAISLAIVFINALSGTIAYSRQRRVDYRTGAAFALATIPGTVLGVWTTAYLSRQLFSLIFGAVVIALSVFLLVRPQRGVPAQRRGKELRRITDASGETFTYSFNLPGAVAISFGVGFLAGLLGIGGGIIHVPVMVFLLGFPTHIATATSHFVLSFTALTGSLTHAVSGIYAGTWELILWLAVGVVPGAQLGAWISRRVRGLLVLRLLAIGLTALGIRLVVLAW